MYGAVGRHCFACLPASQGDAVPLGSPPCRGESLTPDPRNFRFAVLGLFIITVTRPKRTPSLAFLLFGRLDVCCFLCKYTKPKAFLSIINGFSLTHGLFPLHYRGACTAPRKEELCQRRMNSDTDRGDSAACMPPSATPKKPRCARDFSARRLSVLR